MSGPNGPQQSNDPGAPVGGDPVGSVSGPELDAATQQFNAPTQQHSPVSPGEQPTQVWAAPPQAGAPQAYSQAGNPPPEQWVQQQYSTPNPPQSGYPEQAYQAQGYQQPVYGQQQYPAYAAQQPEYAQQPDYVQQQAYPQQGMIPQQYGQAAYPAPEQAMAAPVAGTATLASKKPKGKFFAIIGGAALLVVIAVVLVLGFAWPGFFNSKTLDHAAAENGVKQVLTNSYGANVSAVTCPSGVKVEQGATFTCDVTIDGSTQKVTSTFTDNSGTYEVARPSGS